MKRTKIVCTIGPASSNEEIISDMIDSGMDVARFNCSHSNYESFTKGIKIIKKLRKKKNIPISLLLDTKGPEIRIGQMKKDSFLEEGSEFVLYPDETLVGNSTKAGLSFPDLSMYLKKDDRILVDDGLICLNVEKIEDKLIFCKVVYGGYLKSRKSVNIPDVEIPISYVSNQDIEDLKFGYAQGFDYIAASFVRSANDIEILKSHLHIIGWSQVKIIAKIENRQGVENIDEILKVVDGIMIARGDLGVEFPLEQIPAIQKELIRKVIPMGKVVITATQMLESMVDNPRPTRAETTDVANAVYDGTSALMLSGETAAGKYPVDAVKTMSLIAKTTEQNINYKKRFYSIDSPSHSTITNAISHATVMTAYDLDAKAIISLTKSGSTPRMVARYRPTCKVIACTPDEEVYNQMNLIWGVIPLLFDETDSTDELVRGAIESCIKNKLVEKGDLIVLTAGVPLGTPGTTNMLKIDIC
ncbi:MAG: pyruvate kinase [Ruminococcaceae bacterium]|nr:pyruvate kinase [Oscillospiraceae bacterium]